MDRIERVADAIAQQEKLITRKALIKSAAAAGLSMVALEAALRARGVDAAMEEMPLQADSKQSACRASIAPARYPAVWASRCT